MAAFVEESRLFGPYRHYRPACRVTCLIPSNRLIYGGWWKRITFKQEVFQEKPMGRMQDLIAELCAKLGCSWDEAYDQRRILVCGMVPGKVHVEWLNPAAPGVDSKWEMQLYGLVRTGKRREAIHFLRETRRMSRNDASKRVAQITAQLGMK
jgi:hypothetical protein